MAVRLGIGGGVSDAGELAGELELDDLDEAIDIDGLDEEWGELAVVEFVHAMLDLIGGHAGENNDGESAAMFLDVGQDIKAIFLRHAEIEEEHVDGFGFEMGEGGFAGAGFVDNVSLAAKEGCQDGALVNRIIAQ